MCICTHPPNITTFMWQALEVEFLPKNKLHFLLQKFLERFLLPEMSCLFTIWNQPFWHFLVTGLGTGSLECQPASQIMMQNSQLHGIGRTQTGAKQLAPVTLAGRKLNANTHDRDVGLCELVAVPGHHTENQPPTEAIMIPSSPSGTVVFWAASFYKPCNYGLVKRSFCLAIFLGVTFFSPAQQVIWP